MESDIGKAAVEVTAKVAESILPKMVKSTVDLLAGRNSRKQTERARADRRRSSKERRISRPEDRLRKGFWFQYQRGMDVENLRALSLSPETRDHFFRALAEEAAKFQFLHPSGAQVDASAVVDSALDVHWPRWEQLSEERRTPMLCIGEIAKYLASHYSLVKSDRRKGQRRKAAATG